MPEGNIEICVDSDIHKDIKLDISNHTATRAVMEKLKRKFKEQFAILKKSSLVDDELKICIHSNKKLIYSSKQLEAVKQTLGHEVTPYLESLLPRLHENSQILYKILQQMKHGNLAKQMICFRIKACRNSVGNWW